METTKPGKFQGLKKSLGKTRNEPENIETSSDVDIKNVENEINFEKIDHIKETNFSTINETLEPIFLGHCLKFYGYLLITSWITAVIGYELITIELSTLVSQNRWGFKFLIEFSLRGTDRKGVGIFTGYMLGATTSGIINGILCDRYGRKTVYTYNSVVHILGSIFQMIPWYPGYIINKFLLGFSSIGILISSYLLIFEYSNSNTRIVSACFFRSFESFGLLLIILLGGILGVNWRIRDLVSISLNFGFVLGIWLLPESKKWEKMKAFEIKLIKILKLVDTDIYKFDRFYKNENFKFPHSYRFLFTWRYFIQFTSILIIVTFLSPQFLWSNVLFVGNSFSDIMGWPGIWFDLASVIPLIYYLAYLSLKITRNRKLLLFSMLFLPLSLECLIIFLFKILGKFSTTLELIGTLFSMIAYICLNSVFIIIVLVIVEQSPTNTRGGILGLLITCQFITFLAVYLINTARSAHNFHYVALATSFYSLARKVLCLISLIFVNVSQGVVIVNTWYDLVKFSQEYQEYMY